MSDMKAESISVLKKSSDYKVWSSQMLGYLTFIEADEALIPGDLKNADYKKANTRAKGVILMHTDNSFHHLLYQNVGGIEVMKIGEGHVGVAQNTFWYPRCSIHLVAVLVSHQVERNG